MKVLVLAFALCLLAGVLASDADFAALNLAASGPLTYNHQTGGGAWNDATKGRDLDIVESLEGGDFTCGDHVTFLARIQLAQAVVDPVQGLKCRFSFTADSTGQSGVAFTSVIYHGLNTGNQIQNGDSGTGQHRGPTVLGFDSAYKSNGDESITVLGRGLTGPAFTPQSRAWIELIVNNLNKGEVVIVRLDARISCIPGARPTGNLQGALEWAYSYLPPRADQAISAGQQTIPLLNVNNVQGIDCAPTGTKLTGTAFTAKVTVTQPGGGQVTNDFSYSWTYGSYLMTNTAMGFIHLSTFDYACSYTHSGEYLFLKSSCGCEAIKLNNDQPQLFFDSASNVYFPTPDPATINGVSALKYTARANQTQVAELYVTADASAKIVRVVFRDGTIWDFSNVVYTAVPASTFNVPNQVCACRRRSDIALVLERSNDVTGAFFAAERTFAVNLTKQFVIGPDNTQFAVLNYNSQDAAVSLSIDQGTSASNVASAINSLSCTGNAKSPCVSTPTGDGNVTKALLAAITALQASTRSFTTKSVVFVTNGWADTLTTIAPVVDMARRLSINVFVVSYATILDEAQLAQLASSPDFSLGRWGVDDLLASDPIDIASRICLQNSAPCGAGCCGICDAVCQTCLPVASCAPSPSCSKSNKLVGNCCVEVAEEYCAPAPAGQCKKGVCDAALGTCAYVNSCVSANGTTSDVCYNYVCVDGTCQQQLKEAPLNACDKPSCGPAGVVHTTCSTTDKCKVASCDAASKSCVLTDLTDPSPNAKTACEKRVCVDGTYVAQAIPGCTTGCTQDCTLTDKCSTGYCATGTGPTPACKTDVKNCTSPSLCMTAQCDPATGACKLTEKSCNDNNNCTTDSCDAATGQCRNIAKNCSFADKCLLGSCDAVSGSCLALPLSCDDNISCTIDTCDPVKGCVHTPSNALCNDGDPCNTEVCDATTGCKQTEEPCPTSENFCEVPVCVPFSGCNIQAFVCNATNATHFGNRSVSPRDCDVVFCDEDAGQCSVQENECAVANVVIVSTAIGVGAIIGIIVAAVVVIAAAGGGVAAAVTSFSSDAAAPVTNNPLYAGKGRGGDNPLHRR